MPNFKEAGEAGRAIIAAHLIEGGPGDPGTLELAATLCNLAPAMVEALRMAADALEGDIFTDAEECGASVENARAVRRKLREILARIDGTPTECAHRFALDGAMIPVCDFCGVEGPEGTPTAQPAAPTGEGDGLERHNMLALSTAHIRPETSDMMQQDSAPSSLVFYEKGDFGWFVYVWPKLADWENLPADLADCLAFARARGFSWLMFDCDAEQVPGLPVYDWEGGR